MFSEQVNLYPSVKYNIEILEHLYLICLLLRIVFQKLKIILRPFAPWNIVLLQSKQLTAHYRFDFLPRYEIKKMQFTVHVIIYTISVYS